MHRTVESIIKGQKVIDDGDMTLFRALPQIERRSLGPFVFLDHYKHDSKRGIGDQPHPHAGIEVYTYLIKGKMEHSDSRGFKDVLEQGDSQWIRAGSGILHAEKPFEGRHGLQLWTALPPEKSEIEPAYKSFKSNVIPVIEKDGATIQVLTGTVDGVRGLIESETPTVLSCINFSRSTSIEIEVNESFELGLYGVLGSFTVDNKTIQTGELAVLSSGDKITWKIFFSGPFVATSKEGLSKAEKNFVAGNMGTLDGVPF
ncbi:pirin family protein [Peribacillus loiseleuriae]|uniref:pirin family protein n=1 Tax=Peribacillus loiseleuriae TaxID=1679170 RepID=UPI003D05CC7D